jgi:hypothetical protein
MLQMSRAPSHPVFGGICFLTFCARLAGCIMTCFYVSKLLRIGVLFTALFLGFLFRCRVVAFLDVVLYLIVLLGRHV